MPYPASVFSSKVERYGMSSMGTLRGLLRLLHVLVHLLKGIFICYTALRVIQNHDVTEVQHKAIQTWLYQVTKIIGVDLKVHGTPHKSPAFVVANHISWLDIVIIASVLPVSFLSKSEVRRWPVIGTLATKAGTLFIRRGTKNGVVEAISLMCARLKSGNSVAAFPEGTTTDGSSVRVFHPRLFAAAIETDSTIQPVALVYPHADGVNPIVPYVRKSNLVRHAFRIMSAKRTVAEITLCKPVPCDGRLRKQLAQLARNAIAEVVETAA